jgi:uncharacterized protein YlxW (UPF0749 family)
MTDDAQGAPASVTPPASPPTESARGLARRLAFRPSRPHLLIGLLFLVLGVLVTVAVLKPGDDQSWRTARTEDLVQILDDLDARQQRLEAESARLTALQKDLESGSTTEAVAEAQRRLAALQVLSGTTPVSGPGVEITLTDPARAVDAPLLLDAVQELRDAGAEAIAVGDQRIVVDSWFGDTTKGVAVNGVPVASPIRILAIGDPDTITAALSIPGGLADTVRTRGAEFAASPSQAMSISVTVPKTTN